MGLTVCFVAFVLVACSEEPDRVDREETEAAPQRTVAQSTGSVDAAAQGPMASGYVEDQGILTIEEARLQGGQEEEGDQIVVRAAVGGRVDERGCFLMEGPDWFDLERAIEGGAALPDAPQQLESLWAAQLPADEFSGGNTYVEIFREDPEAGGEEADPSKTPFFAFCYKDTDPGGADRPTAFYDVAHVEGTP